MREAELGMAARLAGDPDLADLIGKDAEGDVRLYWGWPVDVLEKPSEEEFPRGSYFLVVGTPHRRTRATVDIQLDWFVWPSGADGGKARLDAIDERAVELLHEATWVFDGRRLYGLAGRARDFPAGPGAPLRRSRTITIQVL